MRVLVQGWSAGIDDTGMPISAETPEQLLQALRNIRTSLLYDSDYTQASDSPLSKGIRKSWATFRQELRDFPSKFTVENITGIVDFPEPPVIGRPTSWVNIDPDIVLARRKAHEEMVLHSSMHDNDIPHEH